MRPRAAASPMTREAPAGRRRKWSRMEKSTTGCACTAAGAESSKTMQSVAMAIRAGVPASAVWQARRSASGLSCPLARQSRSLAFAPLRKNAMAAESATPPALHSARRRAVRRAPAPSEWAVAVANPVWAALARGEERSGRSGRSRAKFWSGDQDAAGLPRHAHPNQSAIAFSRRWNPRHAGYTGPSVK